MNLIPRFNNRILRAGFGSGRPPRWQAGLWTLFVALALSAQAQLPSLLLHENFESVFPGTWSTGDSNTASGEVYWDDKDSAFGSINAYAGIWKGYCAGTGFIGPVETPRYTNNMRAYMAKSVNLAASYGANLQFHYAIPSIDASWDFLRVYIDNTQIWQTSVIQTNWARVNLPLNAYVGSSRTLKFEFYTDNSVLAEGAYLDEIRVTASTRPIAQGIQTVADSNYDGYIMPGQSIPARVVWEAANFTGTNAAFTNVLSFRLLNGATPHPILDYGGASTNLGYTYNITNIYQMATATNIVVTNVALLRPGAWMSHFDRFSIECRLLTNGVVAQTLTTPALQYWHFTNTVSGDPAWNVLLNLTNSTWTRTFAVEDVAGKDSFNVKADFQLRRYDDYTLSSPTTNNVQIVFNTVLRDASGTVIPLVDPTKTYTQAVPSYRYAGLVKEPAVVDTTRTLSIKPVSQLNSVNKTYYLTLSIAHINTPSSGQIVSANSDGTVTNRLLHLNGTFNFDNVATKLTDLASAVSTGLPGATEIPVTVSTAYGYLTASSTHTYDAAGPLAAMLHIDGTLRYTGGPIPLNGPDNDSVKNVRFRRSSPTLSSSGAKSDIVVILPAGFGYRTNNTVFPVAYSTIPFDNVPLTPSLEPAQDLEFKPGGLIYATEETKPAWLITDRIVWFIGTGSFEFSPVAPGAEYVRAEEYHYLQSVSNNLVMPGIMGDRKSNERYWLNLAGVFAPSVIAADSKSNAVLSTQFEFDKGGFRTHFPFNVVLHWNDKGFMEVRDDLVPADGKSVLVDSSSLKVPYTRDCPDCGGAGIGIDAPSIDSSNRVFTFTRDGGLVAAGPTPEQVDLQWGAIGPPVSNFAQQALKFDQAAFHMPGFFLRGNQTTIPPLHRPAVILYTGVKADDLTRIERPLTAAYAEGLADYAGLNFRCLADKEHMALSTIASLPGIDWQLTGRSKYYIRSAGVTGIHEAVPGSFPEKLTLWGYNFEFSMYGLGYMDSQVRPLDSRTDGLVDLPSPAGFVQNFDNLVFSCLGAPTSADPPKEDGFKVMQYWLADFKTHTIEFKTPTGCDTTKGYLVLGIEGYASHVDKPLFGNIGFFNDGDIIPKSANLSGIESRLKLPNVIKIDGPNNSTYTFTPVADAYYNTKAGSPPAPTAGWMNIFGKLDVPYFEDMQLHLQTSCRTNADSTVKIYLSGGWPRSGSSNPNYGWLNPSGKTPFQTNFFDWANRGWPGSGGGLTIANYRNNTTGEQYHPRAQRVWLDFIDFDYPLTWNDTLRSFSYYNETENDFFIVKLKHHLTYMDAQRAELDFGAQYDGLPKISIANLAFNAIDETTGIAQAVIEAAQEPVHDVLATGLEEFEQLLDTQLNRLMDGVFDRTIDPVIDQFYGTLSNQWAAAWNSLPISQRQQFVASVSSNMANIFTGKGPFPVANNLSGALRDLGSGVTAANNLVGQVNGYLSNIVNSIDAVNGTINHGVDGQAIGGTLTGLIGKTGNSRPVVDNLVQSIVGQVAPQFIDAVVGPTLNSLVQEMEPALSQISEALGQTRSALTNVQAQLKPAGAFAAEIDNTLKSFSGELTNVSVRVAGEVEDFFGELNYSVDNPFQHVTAAQVKAFIRQKIEDKFYATTAASQIQTVLRQRLYDLDASMREQMDSVFQQLNNAMRDLISQSLAEVDNSINETLGDVSDVIGAGKLQGHAVINGDSLKLLRIDGHFEFKVPDSMELDAYLQIKELQSDGTPNPCLPANGKATEVTIGANNVPVDWLSPDLHANLMAKFTFDGTTPLPVNLGGSFSLVGDLSYEAFVLHDLEAALAFGKYENYVALGGGVRFNGYDFSGAVFFGRTCSIEPLQMIDPMVAEVLGNPPFTGAYCYAQGWLPVSEMILGVPASCLFTISAGVGAGAFYFAEGPTYGGKMFLGVSGELLCVVSIGGEITMIGLKQGDDLRFKGHGHFEADIGPCPFCISVSKDVDVSYINKSWNID